MHNAALRCRPIPPQIAALLSLLVRVPFRPRLKAGPTASLTFHFLAAQLEQAFALTILTFDFLFSAVLVHVFLDLKSRLWVMGAPRREGAATARA
jgi:hypothetical protein